MDLAGGLIALVHGGDPKVPLHFPNPQELEQIALASHDRRLRYVAEQNARFARLAERYRDYLVESDPAALALLQRVCLFRLGVTEEVLVSTFTGEDKERVSGAALAAFDRSQLRAKLSFLVEMRLLERVGNDTYTAHPAVLDGFIQTLDAGSIQEGHAAASSTLTASLGTRPGRETPPPDQLDLLEEIIYHTYASGNVEEAFDLVERSFSLLALSVLGHVERVERVGRKLAGDNTPQRANKPDKIDRREWFQFLIGWGFSHIYIGKLEDARYCFSAIEWKNEGEEGRYLTQQSVI